LSTLTIGKREEGIDSVSIGKRIRQNEKERENSVRLVISGGPATREIFAGVGKRETEEEQGAKVLCDARRERKGKKKGILRARLKKGRKNLQAFGEASSLKQNVSGGERKEGQLARRKDFRKKEGGTRHFCLLRPKEKKRKKKASSSASRSCDNLLRGKEGASSHSEKGGEIPSLGGKQQS